MSLGQQKSIQKIAFNEENFRRPMARIYGLHFPAKVTHMEHENINEASKVPCDKILISLKYTLSATSHYKKNEWNLYYELEVSEENDQINAFRTLVWAQNCAKNWSFKLFELNFLLN